MSYSTDAIRHPVDKDDEVYPCAGCGILRSENQGAKIFTVCDSCWDKQYRKECAHELRRTAPAQKEASHE